MRLLLISYHDNPTYKPCWNCRDYSTKHIGAVWLEEIEGIDVITNEESYTSKCSFFDEETIKKHDVYLGKRIKRGSYNIIKKAIPNAFANGIQGLAVNPLKLNVL